MLLQTVIDSTIVLNAEIQIINFPTSFVTVPSPSVSIDLKTFCEDFSFREQRELADIWKRLIRPSPVREANIGQC